MDLHWSIFKYPDLMKKFFILILILFGWLFSNAQSPLRINKYLVDSLVSGYWRIYHDTTHTGQWQLLGGSAGGGGSLGTVTSVAAGFGHTFTTITSTGSVIADTTSGGLTSWVRTKKVVDSLNALWGVYRMDANNNVTGGTNNYGAITSGTFNIALTNNAFNSTTSGSRNIDIGPNSLTRITTASDMVNLGYRNQTHVTTGSGNSMPGISIGHDNNGYITYKNLTIGAYNVGYNVDSVDATTSYAIAADNIAIGVENLLNLRTGLDNTAIGWGIMETLDSGSFNNAYGQYSLAQLVTGHRNNAFGFRAGKRLIGGDKNIFIGDSSGVGGSNITMWNSIFIGARSRWSTVSIPTNMIVIGDSAEAAQNNLAVIGRAGTFLAIARTTATESIHTDGAIIIGAAAATTNGTIQWTGSDFEGRKGGAWVSLTNTGTVTSVGSGYGLTGGAITTSGTLVFDSATVFSQLTLDRILSNEFNPFGYYEPKIYDEVDIDMNGNFFFINNVNDFAVNLNTNEWAISGNNGGANTSTIISNDVTNRLRIITGFSSTKKSEMQFVPDSIRILPGGNGAINIDSIRNGSTFSVNKIIGWRDNNGVVGYITPDYGITLTSGLLKVDSFSIATRAWLYKVVDSLPTGGGGLTVGTTTITSGTSGTLLYDNAGVLGKTTGTIFATSGTNITSTAQAATDVVLNVKGAGSQSANIQNWSSSSGTGDLASMTSAGYFQAVRGGFGGSPTSHTLYVTKATGADDLARVESTSGNAIFNIKAAGEAWLKLTATATNWYVISGNRSGGAGIDFSVTDNGGTDYLVIDGNDHTLRLAETTSSTPASGFTNIYPKSDGLFYSKDDAGVETMASNYGLALSTTGGLWSIRNSDKQGADVASVAGAIALGTDGNAFEITGTNAITLISNVNWQNGAVVTLVFTSTASLTDGTANSGTDIGMELAGNANFTGSAGATLSLRLLEVGGTQRWREISRSVQ